MPLVPGSIKVSIVIPVKDEAESIGLVCADVLKVVPELKGYACEVICVDDHSTDRTAAVAASLGVRVIAHQGRAGKGRALRTGFAAATGDVLVMMDGDYSHKAEDLPLMLAALQGDVGLVVGSRLMGGSDEFIRVRALGNLLFTALFGVFHHRYLTDALNGFKAFRRDVFTDFEYSSGAFEIEIELASNERIYHVDCFSPQAERFRHDEMLKEVGSEYYGTPHSVHLCLYERHRPHDVPVRGFHVDTFELSTYKVMLYLNDVTDQDGPTSYLVGTHTDADLRHQKEHVWGPATSPGDPSGQAHPTNFTDEELGDRLTKHVKVTGPLGTIVLFDTWGVHKGITPKPGGERHVLVNYYRKGANLPRSDFGFNTQADHQRYHVDYRKHMEPQQPK